MFSQRTRYILRLFCYLGEKNLSTYQTVESLADETGIPEPYLGKLVGFLSEEGYLETRKGPTGGVALARDPAKINLEDLLEATGEFDHAQDMNDTCCLPDLLDRCFVEEMMTSFREKIIGGVTLQEALEEL